MHVCICYESAADRDGTDRDSRDKYKLVKFLLHDCNF